MRTPPETQFQTSDLDLFRDLASRAPDILERLPAAIIRQAILIREVETTFLELFSQGRMNGTVHTCTGQEFSAVAVAGQLRPEDWVTSNHRCHGHFIAKTGNWKGLVDELMGLNSGVCKGIGSSQHLFAKGFLSNGPQASLVPVATGIGLYNKHHRNAAISVSFIGEGTFGEGVLYESLNIASLWNVPQLIVCENNLYSQSTFQSHGLAGSIRGRAEAFGIRYFEADTWNATDLFQIANQAIDYVRNDSRPAFLTVRTYRLNAHSKGDDDRQQAELAYFRERDPLNRLLAQSEAWRLQQAAIRAEIGAHIDNSSKSALTSKEYVFDQLPRRRDDSRTEVRNDKVRMSQALNGAYRKSIAAGAYMIGEDILDPYGGAFKVTKGLSSEFPQRVLGAPISEAAIVGVGIGLSIMGAPAYVEIMFGDFVTNIFDQLINNASKFFHMYAFQVSVPLRVRSPMGGKRGYGPTHSQSLEKHLLGMDNLAVFALSSLEDPGATLAAIHKLPMPTVIIESKVDYGRFLWQGNADYHAVKVGGDLGALVISPVRRRATVTVVAYGDTAREIADHAKEIFLESDHVVELVVPFSLHPLDLQPIREAARRTGLVIVVEEGSVAFGIGSEVIAQLCETLPDLKFVRLGAEPVPVPSILALENELLPSARKLMSTLMNITTEVQS
jgi:2-oxoisovalerate dehydrogenase E1 component